MKNTWAEPRGPPLRTSPRCSKTRATDPALRTLSYSKDISHPSQMGIGRRLEGTEQVHPLSSWMLRVVESNLLQQCLLDKGDTRDKSQDLIAVILGRVELHTLREMPGPVVILFWPPLLRSRAFTERIFSSASVSTATGVMLAFTSPTAITLLQGKCRIY
jgi:hypothetical protein